VSGTPAGVGGAGDSSTATTAAFDPSVIAFVSDAEDLVPGDGNGVSDVFVHDRATGTTQLVSVAAGGGTAGNGASTRPVVSNDGTKVAFVSVATDLVGGRVSGAGDVYVRDLAAGTTSLVSVDGMGGGGGNGPSDGPTFSSDGRRLAFTSDASNLGPSDANGVSDVYVRDLVEASTTLVSVNAAGTGAGNGPSQNPSWAEDHSTEPDSLAFESQAGDLTSPTDSGVTWDVYVRRLAEGTTVLASVRAGRGGGGNGDSRNPVHGRDFVVFESEASDLGATDGNGTTDIYLRDLRGATTSLLSANPSGVAGSDASTWPVIDNRSAIYFQSDASDLVATDTNGTTDVFLRTGPFTVLESVNAEGTDSGNGPSTMPGQLLDTGGLAFNSEATDLGPPDTNGVVDVFTRHSSGVTYAISANSSRRATGNGPSRLTTPRGQQSSGPPVFVSEATDLGPSVGGSSQVYVSQPVGADLSLGSLAVSQIVNSVELFYKVINDGPEPADVDAFMYMPPGVTLAPSPGCQTLPDAPALVRCRLGRLLPDAGSTQPSVVFEINAPSGTLIEIPVTVTSPTVPTMTIRRHRALRTRTDCLADQRRPGGASVTTNASAAPFVSSRTMLVAADTKATVEPSPLTAGQ